MWSRLSRSVLWAALLALVTASAASAWDVALVPPVGDDAVVAAARSQLASLGLDLAALSPQQLVDKARLNPKTYPLALLVGGERFADTVVDEGDATAALQAYLDGGGSLIVAANGPVFGRPQRWTGTGWDSVAAPMRRIALATRLGLLDAGQTLEKEPPAGCDLVAGDVSLLGGRVPTRFAITEGLGAWRPIPGSQDASVDFLPLLTLVDKGGATYGAGLAEMRRKGVEGAGSVYYVWAPLLRGPQASALLQGILAARSQRFADPAGRDRAKALGDQLTLMDAKLASARQILPEGLTGPDVDKLRDEVKRHDETLRWLREAVAAGNLEFVATRLGPLQSSVGSLMSRAGRAVDAAVTTAVASASGSPYPTKLVPPLTTTARVTSAPEAGVAGESVEPANIAALSVGEVLLVPDATPRAPLPPPQTTAGGTPPTPDPATSGGPTTVANPGQGTPTTPDTPGGTRPTPGTPGGTTPGGTTPGGTKPLYATTNPVVEFDCGARGKVVIELLPESAPKTCSSFLYLARSGFFEKTYFHRRIEKFVVQGGDPFTKTLPPDDAKIGTGGPEWTVPGEFSQVLTHQRGTLGLARAEGDPDSGGSQFYICLAPQPGLDREYAIFAKVIAGMDVVDKLQIGDRVVKVRVVQGAEPANPAGVGPLDLFNKKPLMPAPPK